MNNRQKRWLKKEIVESIRLYKQGGEADIDSAMLSGMSLVASFLAKKDGSPDFRAADVLVAVCEVANENNMQVKKNGQT